MMDDMLISCVQCGSDFEWPEVDQEFYASMNFTKPKRCPQCRPDRSTQKARISRREVPVAQSHQRNGSPPLIDQESIVKFVKKVEDKKGFKRDVRLVFAHLIEEHAEAAEAIMAHLGISVSIGSLAREIWRYEKDAAKKDAPSAGQIGKELLDIIFLVCYLADILGIDLNAIAPKRMSEIRLEYRVPE